MSFLGIACQSQDQKFIQISPQAGGIKCMLESGSFGSSGSVETYFISFISEREIEREMKHGFIVLKLNRTHKENDRAYKILDRYNELARANQVDISEGSAWDDETKRGILKTRDSAWEINTELNKHLKINIEPEALKTGISEHGYISYQ